MNKIAMDLDFIKIFKMDEEQMVEELKKLKELGIMALILPYEIFINKELMSFKEILLKALSAVQFELYLKVGSVKKYDTTFKSDKILLESIVIHKQFVFNTFDLLSKYGLENGMKVIYEGGACSDGNTALHLDKNIMFFREMANTLGKIKVDILIETLQTDIAKGRRVGDRWQDLEIMMRNIENENFGICWNMKNTRVNYLEYNDRMLPQKQINERIKMSTFSNVNAYIKERRPFNVELQIEELKYLISIEYAGVLHLEYIYSMIEEMNVSYQNVYDSVEYLKYVIHYFIYEKEKNGLVINYGMDQLKRKYVRRRFKEDALAIIQGYRHKFRNIEISENDIKLIMGEKVDFKIGEEYKIMLRVKDRAIELLCVLIIIRNDVENYEYVFKIEDMDRDTCKKIVEMVYSVES